MQTDKLKTLIFDLDGVITSEKKYWNTARLTVWEMICDQQYLGISQYFGQDEGVTNCLVNLGDKIISSRFIYELKSRAINSNWDLTFFVLCLHLASIIKNFKAVNSYDLNNIFNNAEINLKQKLNNLGELLQGTSCNFQASDGLIQKFWQETEAMRGGEVLNYVNIFIQKELGENITFFDPKGELWKLCYNHFQSWYEGKKGYILPDDETVLDLNQIQTTLKTLQNSGRFTLAIATGRPRNEVIQPFTALELLQYFDPHRIVTYDEVLEAELVLSEDNQLIKLGKPHPFVLFKALYPQEEIKILCNDQFQITNGQTIAYVGDAGSDVVAAKRAGCISIGVLTGIVAESERESRRKMLAELGCDRILDSILELPNLLGV